MRWASVDAFARMFSLELIDVLVGVEYGIVRPQDVEAVATRYLAPLAASVGSRDFLVDVALADTTEEKLALIQQLADSARKELSVRKWQYTEISVLYQKIHELSVDETFLALEMIWADFGYDSRVSHLVYYYPLDDADVERASRLGRGNIFYNWRKYLREEGEALSARIEPV